LTGAFKARRAQLRRVVKITMIACVVIVALGAARAGISALFGTSDAAAPRAAREAMTTEVAVSSQGLRAAAPALHAAGKRLAAIKTRASTKNRWRKLGR
jgi:hypothetical protein